MKRLDNAIAVFLGGIVGGIGLAMTFGVWAVGFYTVIEWAVR